MKSVKIKAMDSNYFDLKKSQNRIWNARGRKVTHSRCIITYTAETGLRKIPVSLRPHLFSPGLKEVDRKY